MMCYYLNVQFQAKGLKRSASLLGRSAIDQEHIKHFEAEADISHSCYGDFENEKT